MNSEAEILKIIIDRGDCITIKCSECPLCWHNNFCSISLGESITEKAKERLTIILSNILEA